MNNRECPVSAPSHFPGYLLVPPDPMVAEHAGTMPFPATASLDTYSPLPTPIAHEVTFDRQNVCLVLLTLFAETSGAASEVAIGVDVSGVTLAPVAMRPTQRVRILAQAPQTVGVTLSMQAAVLCQPGMTRLEVMHAGAMGAIADVALTIVPLGLRG